MDACQGDVVYDVAVIGAGPAGTQAAISAAHQMRHVVVLDAGPVSQRKGRAYWSKSVELEDVPVFHGVTGPRLMRALREWLESRPVESITIGGVTRPAGIDIKSGMVMELSREDDRFKLVVSTERLKKDEPLTLEPVYARAVVVASGFEDLWPDIEVDESAHRVMDRYRTLFRYAGNAKGWHVCIRCDGHLHIDRHLAILGVGPDAYGASFGAQDFTDKITIFTNGRPHGFTPGMVRQAEERGIDIVTTKILRHIGKGTDLLGLQLEDGRELFFDGFLLDEGLEANTHFLKGWDVQTDEEGLLVIDEDGQVLDGAGEPVPGLYAAGDIVSGTRNLIATAFGLGQNAGLSASDSLRRWRWPED